MNQKTLNILKKAGYAILIAVVVLSVVSFVLKLKTQKSKVKAKDFEDPDKDPNLVYELPPDPRDNPVHSTTWHQAKAALLYKAMKGAGTDEETIYKVFRGLKSNQDYSKLYHVFGKKDGYTMKGWLHGDLSTYEIKKVNQILASKGITKRI